MSVFRFGRSFFRSFCKQFTDKGKTFQVVVLAQPVTYFSFWFWFAKLFMWSVGLEGSGKVAAKSGVGSGGEIREGHSASVRQLVVASRASQNASVFGRRLWRGFTSAVSVTQAASLRRKFP